LFTKPQRGTLPDLGGIPDFTGIPAMAATGRLTCGSLELLARGLGAVQQELSLVLQDLVRKQKFGRKIRYLLDFSDLYSFLWPEAVTAPVRALSNQLLAGSTLRFHLPPGTILELLQRLRSQQRSVGINKKAMRALLSNPFVKAFLDHVERRPPATGEAVQYNTSDVTQIFGLLRDFRREHQALERLAWLYDNGRVAPVSDIIGVDGVAPDAQVYHSVISELESIRARQDSNANTVDAHNYALAYGLTDHLYRSRNELFFLVTSSPIPFHVFSSITWRNDQHHMLDPALLGHQSLVRHPAQLLYWEFLGRAKQLKVPRLKATLASLATLQTSLISVPELQKYLSGEITDRKTPVTLPTSKRARAALNDFVDFYRQVFRPVAETLAGTAALQENQVLLDANVRTEREDPEGSGGPSGPEVISPPRTERLLLSTLDALVALSEKELGRARRQVRVFDRATVADLERSGGIIQPDDFIVDRRDADDVEDITVKIVTAVDVAPLVYFNVDRFSDYFSAWWRCNLPFPAFLVAMHRFTSDAHAWASSNGHPLSDERRRATLGVFAMNAAGSHSIAVPDFSGDTIIDAVRTVPGLHFIRIGHWYGDVCYDFVSVGAFPQRAGIVTHLSMPEAIARFVHSTNARRAQFSAVAEVVRDVLRVPTQEADDESTIPVDR
jgi:hypothetical protein